MKYKIVRNENDKLDCKHCFFQDTCGNICPLKTGFYFSRIEAEEPDYMRYFYITTSSNR